MDVSTAATVPVVAPDRLGDSTLPDGRRLGWSECGPPTGRTVLLCPGAATSRWLGLRGRRPRRAPSSPSRGCHGRGTPTDTVLSMTRWPFDLGAINVPVDLRYGTEDTSPVHSPDAGGWRCA